MDAPVQYLEELRGDLGLYPTWLPGEHVELGAFGTIVRGRFVADGTLANLGIAVVPREREEKLPIKKQRGMRFAASTHTAAEASWIDAALGIDLSVAREHAWAFAARGMTAVEIDNIHEVRRVVLEARKAGDWRKEWLLVSEIRRVEHLTVLVARSRAARGRIRATGKVKDAIDVLLEQDVRFELSTDDVFAVPGVRNATPLYGVRKLKGFLDPQLRAIASGERDEREGDDALELEVANDEPMF